MSAAEPWGMHANRTARWGGILLALSIAGAAVVGCTGAIGDPSEASGLDPASDDAAKDALVDSTRFPRLTHAQWENTVRDLLKLATAPGLSSSFTTDPPGSTFGNDGNLLKVTPGLWGDYQKAAETLGETVTKDTSLLAKLVPSDGDVEAKAKAFIDAFAFRAYRRPLADEETAQLVGLFKQGPALTGLPDPIAAGVQVVVTAVLQSPFFEYRVEVGEKKDDGSIGLTSWEMASRLSYSLWNTMPDDELFAAAKSGALATNEGVETQARRLLDDKRAEPMIADFHAKLFDYDHFDSLNKDATLFPDWPSSGMDKTLRTEAEMFVREVTINQKGGLSQLLTANFTFVNDKLAPLYGLSGSYGPEFQKVALDPSQRAGFLTQIGFLAANASPRETDPIHRGVFVNLKIICADLPPPPGVIPPLPKDEGGTMTMRERISAHTGKNTCGSGCHGTMINPAGFAFETFDAVGKWRTTDKGKPVNAADTYPFADGAQTYDGPVQFAKVLAARPQVHQCYSGNWLEYTYGRQKAEGDTALIERVAAASMSGASTKELILKLVLERSFSRRPGGGS